MEKSMKRIIMILLLAIIAIYPIMAQDATPTEEVDLTAQATVEAGDVTIVPDPTDEPTLEVATETPGDFITPTPDETQVPAPVPTETGGDGGGDTGGGGSGGGMDPNMVFIGLVLLLLVYTLLNQFTGYKLGKELAKAVPPEWLPVIQHGTVTAQRLIYERAAQFADSTETPIDNNLLDHQMKLNGWEFYIDPETKERRARQKPAAVAQSGSTNFGASGDFNPNG